jgi:hypothetical protein
MQASATAHEICLDTVAEGRRRADRVEARNRGPPTGRDVVVIAEVQQKVPDLLGDTRPVRIRGDAEDRPSIPSHPVSRAKIEYTKRIDTADHHARRPRRISVRRSNAIGQALCRPESTLSDVENGT